MSRRADSRHVSRQLHVALGLLVWRARERPSDDHLTLSELSALARLRDDPHAAAADLARAEAITPQSMGTTITALLDRKLIQRRPDPNDRRRWRLTLTPAGKRALAGTGDDDGVERLHRAIEGLSAQERATLAKAAPALEHVAQKLRAGPN